MLININFLYVYQVDIEKRENSSLFLNLKFICLNFICFGNILVDYLKHVE